MRKRILPAFLSIALLISLVGCGGSSGVDDAPPSNSIESSQTSSLMPEETPGTTPTQDPSQIPEATQEPIASEELPEETIVPTVEPTEQAAPTSTPASSAPVSTSAPSSEPTSTPTPTSTPAPVHTHSYTITTNATCTSEGIETCSCGKTRSIALKDHQMVVRNVPETGHYEEMTFIKTVDDYEVREVTTWGCRSCDFTVTGEYSDLEKHQIGDRSDPNWEPPRCFASGCWFVVNKQNVKVGSHEETTHENKWIVDTPATTIYVCEVCGYQAW